jgi:subtilisin family serine protease
VLGTSGFGFAATPAVAQEAQPTTPDAEKQLDKRDRDLLADAERNGQQNVTLLVAAERGETDAAADELRSLGAVVEKTDAEIGYVKVSLPRGNAEKAAKLGSVSVVDVDGLIDLDDPRPEGVGTPLPQPAPTSKTPRDNPYMPIRDTGATDFTKKNPKYDGRGTTIAIIDSGIDLDHPALAKTSTGERKIVDWYNANAVNSGDGTWVAMDPAKRRGAFTYSGARYQAPATGDFTIGLFRETAGDLNLANSETGGDINRDGDRTDTFAVLQDANTKDVRVDLDQDGDFTDEKSMIDYKVKQDVGFFGTDDPATAVAERVAFVVQTDRSIYDNGGTAYVGLGISGAAHGTHVAGITSGNQLFGGAVSGAAPGAKLIAVKACLSTPSCTSSGLIDGVVYAARNGADVVNISIGGLPPLNDGNNARAEIYNRVIAEYNVQLFISAGNSGAGANTVGDPSVVTDAVSVGSYITRETWLSNYGSEVKQKESLHGFSSRGPAEDGGFKPNIVAPGSAVSTIPRWKPGGPVPGTYDLPPGYAQLNGTSMAAPQATGAAALLVSAYKAKHNGERPNVAALRNAIYTGADWVSTLGAYEQGNGLFDVPAAAKLLLGSDLATDAVSASVPVSTVLSPLLATPNTGVGIHDREGAVAGREYTRTYTVTRTTGSDRDQTYRVNWTGNDGTFRSASSVKLPLNEPVALEVKVKPRSEGAHSAVLTLDNPRTPGVDLRTLNVVFAAQDFTAAGKYAVTKSGKIERNQSTSLFVRVPQGTTALKVDMAAGGAEKGKGQVRFLRFDPYGIPADTTSSTNCYNPDAGAGCDNGTPTSRTISNPLPGVWEIVVEARRTSDTLNAPFSVTAAVLGAAISPNPDVVPAGQTGVALTRQYSVTNSLGAFTGALTAGALGSAKVARPSIADADQQVYDVTVPAGATALTATIGNPADVSADLDLSVYDCTTGTCALAGSDADGDSEESVTVPAPAGGSWKVVVDAYAVPAGTTEYDYVDLFASDTLGTLTVADANADRQNGATWTASATVTPGASPGADRVLRGELLVRTVDSAVIGRGAVIVESITG